jgi:hypothetical protein
LNLVIGFGNFMKLIDWLLPSALAIVSYSAQPASAQSYLDSLCNSDSTACQYLTLANQYCNDPNSPVRANSCLAAYAGNACYAENNQFACDYVNSAVSCENSELLCESSMSKGDSFVQK